MTIMVMIVAIVIVSAVVAAVVVMIVVVVPVAVATGDDATRQAERDHECQQSYANFHGGVP
jgi:hypothetical protein